MKTGMLEVFIGLFVGLLIVAWLTWPTPERRVIVSPPVIAAQPAAEQDAHIWYLTTATKDVPPVASVYSWVTKVQVGATSRCFFSERIQRVERTFTTEVPCQ